MTLPPTSSGRVPYDLRPSKQAERYILVDLLQKLQRASINVSDYHYVGFGSYFFHDFRLFNQLLGVSGMTSIEGSKKINVRRRCVFNRPYHKVDLKFGISTRFLQRAPVEKDYLIWLDYDFPFGEVCHDDIQVTFARFRIGTIFIVTMDFERPDEDSAGLLDDLAERVPPELTRTLEVSDFGVPKWKKTNIRMVEHSINRALYGRSGISFLRLFYFEYRDTRDMFTFGGIIVDQDTRRNVLAIADRWPFFCRNRLTNMTVIPRFIMTKKERDYLDSIVHAPHLYSAHVGIPRGEFDNYCRFYRFLPIYSEIL